MLKFCLVLGYCLKREVIALCCEGQAEQGQWRKKELSCIHRWEEKEGGAWEDTHIAWNFFYFFSEKCCHLLSTMTLRKLKKKKFQVVDIWKKNDNPLLPLPHSHLPRKYFSTFWPLLLIFASESVIMEPRLTHLETYICVGHLTLLTYFLPFLCYRNLLHLKEWSLYFLMKDRQQRDFVLSVTNAFRVSGTSGVCLGKNGMHLILISCSLLTDLLDCGWGVPCSLSTPKWGLLSKLKVLWIFSLTETVVA